MKKLIAMVLVLMLLAGAALAEGLPYIRQVEQYEYNSATLLTAESYPEACLYAWYPGYYFDRGEGHDPMCLVFPGPAGASPSTFDSSSVHYLDVDKLIQYDYELQQSNSYEEFLNRAEADEYILLDGSDGAAIYIEPGDYSPAGYGLIATKDFGKSAKLWIRIIMDKLDKKLPQDQRIQALTEAITAEVERLRAQMHTEIRKPYWSYGQFSGVKLLSRDFSRLVTLSFPVFEARFKDTDVLQAALVPTRLRYNTLEGIYDFGDGHTVEMRFGLDTYSAPFYALENEENPDVKKLVLENGAEWHFEAANVDDDGISLWYASKPVEGLTDMDQQVYINLVFSGSYGIVWPDEEACRQILNRFEPLITIVDPREDPYVAPEKGPEPEAAPAPEAEPEAAPAAPAPEAEPEAAPAEGSWTCPDCSAENTGNFCANCGAAKPEPEPVSAGNGWTCPDCGAENTGNFCANCGAAKPEESAEWTCPDCGQVNEGNFCANCGKGRP